MDIHVKRFVILAAVGASLFSIQSTAAQQQRSGAAANRPGANNENASRSPADPAVGRATQLIKQGKYPAAITELDAAIKADRKSAKAFVWRGFASNRIGLFSEAIEDCSQALQLEPKNTFAFLTRGYAYFMSGDNGRALADYNAAGAIDPSAPGPFSFRATVYSSMGEQKRALDEVNKALEINPNYGPGYGTLGFIYTKLQQYEKALAVLNKANQLNPHSFGNLFNRGVAYLGLGNNELALADFNNSILLAPRIARSYISRGRIFLGKGDYDAAIKDFNEAIRLQPQNVFALIQRARAYELSRNLKEARTDFQTILGLEPSNGVAIAGSERIEAKIAALTGGPAPVKDHSGARIALVIGNSHYKDVDPLANPERDAKLVADALKRAGFEKVQLLIDATRESLAAALKAFAADAAGADWALVYFAGHGIEVDGSNYLVPTDVKYENDDDIPKESIALDQILNAVGAASKLRLVILDACRENPFVAEMKGKAVSAAGRGLARIEPESGTLVAFATKHGHLATDGTGENSPFAASLVKRISTPGLEISQLFRLVHDDVYASTGQQQEPFTYGQLSAQEFFFKAR